MPGWGLNHNHVFSVLNYIICKKDFGLMHKKGQTIACPDALYPLSCHCWSIFMTFAVLNVPENTMSTVSFLLSVIITMTELSLLSL